MTAATKKKTTLKLVRYVKLPNGKVVVKPPGVSGLLSFAPPPPPPPFVPRVEKVAREKVDGKRPGKLEGSPTRSMFKFDDSVKEACRLNKTGIVRKLPLSLPIYRDPQDFFVTKESAQHTWENTKSWNKTIKDIEYFLPDHPDELFNNKRQFESCAIVGNHGNLLKSRWGAKIDAHEAVFRFNRAMVVGYKAHVGGRTTFRVLNHAESRVYSNGGHRGHHRERVPLADGVTFVLGRLHPDEIIEYMTGMHDYIRIKHEKKDVKFTLMDRRFLMWARDTLAVYRKCLAMSHGVKSSEEKTWMPMMSPSSGLTVILNALHMCKHVSVFGIAEDPIQPGKTPYQYFQNFGSGNVWGAANTDAHNFDLEKLLIADLARNNLIKKCERGVCFGKTVAGDL